MYKELIKIIDQNIKYLNACLDLTEAHITWGTSGVSEKYTKIKTNLLNKMREQEIDKKSLVDTYNQEVQGSLDLDRYFG